MTLNKDQIKHIETVLESGYDCEIRKLRKGITIASVGKKVVYKEVTNEDNQTNR